MACSTYAFYSLLTLAVLGPLGFVSYVWYEGRKRDWNWTQGDSRAMYVDAAKTLITASGIAVALLASAVVAKGREISPLVAESARAAGVVLVTCIICAFLLILIFSRAFERARSRHNDALRTAGKASEDQGRYTDAEFFLVLLFSWLSLSTFLVGFLLLGRIVFHS